jgi:hypothetical protein
MANEDEAFDGMAIAVGVQTALGDPNTTIRGLTGTIDETDGCVLGDKASGDAESGISSPSLEGIFREVPAVRATAQPRPRPQERRTCLRSSRATRRSTR